MFFKIATPRFSGLAMTVIIPLYDCYYTSLRGSEATKQSVDIGYFIRKTILFLFMQHSHCIYFSQLRQRSDSTAEERDFTYILLILTVTYCMVLPCGHILFTAHNLRYTITAVQKFSKINTNL